MIYNDLHEAGDNEILNNQIYEDVLKTNVEKIEIENISFKYPTSKENVIENVTFEIPIGSSVALIGTSGAGKTTIVDLLLGLLKPNAGQLKLIIKPI